MMLQKNKKDVTLVKCIVTYGSFLTNGVCF